MKNYWLEKRNNDYSNKNLERLVDMWNENILHKNLGEKFTQTVNSIDVIFGRIAGFILKAFDIKVFGHNFDVISAICSCKDACWKKVSKFDPQKGKAFNFFTTIIFNKLRQEYLDNKAVKN